MCSNEAKYCCESRQWDRTFWVSGRILLREVRGSFGFQISIPSPIRREPKPAPRDVSRCDKYLLVGAGSLPGFHPSGRSRGLESGLDPARIERIPRIATAWAHPRHSSVSASVNSAKRSRNATTNHFSRPNHIQFFPAASLGIGRRRRSARARRVGLCFVSRAPRGWREPHPKCHELVPGSS